MLSGKYMPKTPKGHKRKIATGAIEDTLTEDGKSKAAVELGRKGGIARAKSMDKRERAAIAKKAATARWKGRAQLRSRLRRKFDAREGKQVPNAKGGS